MVRRMPSPKNAAKNYCRGQIDSEADAMRGEGQQASYGDPGNQISEMGF